jgi:RND family efflux transporter MFP subunit
MSDHQDLMKRLTHTFSQPFLRFFRLLRRRWKLTLFLVLVAGAVFFFLSKRNAGKTVVLQTEHPQRESIAETLDVSGVVDAKEKASLSFATGGKVTYVGAKEGDVVKKNQTIVRIDARALQNQLQQNLNSYFNERMTFEQNRENNLSVQYTNAVDRSQQQDQKTLENSVLDVEYQTIAIQSSFLSSPFAGILVDSPASTTGTILSTTDDFNIVNPQSLIFKAEVDQADIAKVQKGQKVNIQLDAYPDQSIGTTINYIAYRSSASSTGTVYIVQMILPIGDLSAPLDRFRLGMNGDAKIILAEKENVLTIPLSATKDKDNKTFVTVKTGEKTTEEREIQTGLENDDKVEVTSGLIEVDEVVIP